MSKLVIVESPTKVKSVKKYLGSDYTVMASKGHIRDLPKSKLGIDVANGFAPQYVSIPEKKELIKQLIEQIDQKTHQIDNTDKIQQMDPKGDQQFTNFHTHLLTESAELSNPLRSKRFSNNPSLRFSSFYHTVAALSM